MIAQQTARRRLKRIPVPVSAVMSASLPRRLRGERNDAREQVILGERLRQVPLHARLQHACSQCFVGIGRDQNGGDGFAAGHQSIMEFRTCDSRHLHIRDQARRVMAAIRIQKLRGRRERHRAIAQRSNEARQGLSNQFVIVDDRNYDFIRQCLTLFYVKDITRRSRSRHCPPTSIQTAGDTWR